MSAYEVRLTGAELELLATVERPEVRAVIEKARYHRSLEVAFGIDAPRARMLGEVLTAAAQKKRVAALSRSAHRCPLCKQRGETYTPRRTRRNPRPSPEFLPIRVWDLQESFVIVEKHVSLGWCEACHDGGMRDALIRATADVALEVPERLTGVPPRFRSYERVRCQKPDCGWEGHEGQMRRHQTLMGGGTFPAACPKCGDARAFLSQAGPVSFTPPEWVAVPVEVTVPV